jgi:hypothetical protein
MTLKDSPVQRRPLPGEISRIRQCAQTARGGELA